MVKCNSFEKCSIYLNLHDQQQVRLNNINEVEDYFITEIKKRELISKSLSKYIATFHYFDKSFIALFGTSGSISIVSFTTVIGESFSLALPMPTKIVKKLLKHEIKRKSIIKLLC